MAARAAAPMAAGLLLDGRLRDRGHFRTPAKSPVSGTSTAPAAPTIRHRLWQLVMLELWFDRSSTGSGRHRRAPPRRRRSRRQCKSCAALPESSRPMDCAGGHARGRRDARRHRASRPGRRGPVRRRARRPRPPPPEHRRSRRRPPAARNEDRPDLDRLQRRDLQPRRHPAGAGSRGASSTGRVPIPKRSSTRTSSGATPASTASAACSRSRSGMRRAGVCCSRATGLASSRSTGRTVGNRMLFGVGDQGDPRERTGPRRSQRRRVAGTAEYPLPVGRRDAVQRHPPAAARAHARVRRRARSRSGSTGMFPSACAIPRWSAFGARKRSSVSASCSRKRCACG